MCGQVMNRLRHVFSQSFEKPAQFIATHFADDRVVGFWCDALAKHDLDPAVFGEQFLVFSKDAPGLAKQFDLMLERLGYLKIGALPPEGAVSPFRHLVMQDEKIADLPHVGKLLIIEFSDIVCADRSGRQHPDQTQDSPLNEMDTGGFQRFHKTARQTDGDAIAVPLLSPGSRSELQLPRFGHGRPAHG